MYSKTFYMYLIYERRPTVLFVPDQLQPGDDQDEDQEEPHRDKDQPEKD